MSEGPSASLLLAKTIKRYRESMTGCLEASLAGVNDFLSPVDFEDVFASIGQTEFDDDPVAPFRSMSYLLIAKVRLHVFAALRANKESNIHSLAVQMRPALECAGQVVSMFRDLFGKGSGAEDRISRYLNADYYQTVIRLSRGQVDYNEILDQINTAMPVGTGPVRKIKSLGVAEKVNSLEFGENWYGHLSECFYHSDLSGLKNHSFFGGVASCNTTADDYGFAELLDYMAYQVMVMVMYSAVCPDDRIDDDRRFEKATKRLEQKKAISAGFRKRLSSKAGEPDSGAVGSGTVR